MCNVKAQAIIAAAARKANKDCTDAASYLPWSLAALKICWRYLSFTLVTLGPVVGPSVMFMASVESVRRAMGPI